ncbi:MAG: DegT/DnrJ/EryC1/StrS family aminotransferase, partial [Deltaproteobacteria bacterium]|nr:DegT/DnrJ/EryC1/StrS family aminotransferase [Deltaproteobacteria bacterium]
MPIAFVDLKRQFQAMEDEIRSAIDGVLNHAQFIMGPELGQFEEALSDYLGVKHAIGCSSGTDALLIPLMALGLKPGDAVFTPTFTFIATAEVISFLGATPVFVDIDPMTFNLDPALLREAVEKVKREGELNPRAVIPVDMFGLPADYTSIQAVADEYDLFVLEDAAQSFGGTRGGQKAGGFGNVAATSFFPAKPLGAYADGGAIFTNDDELADQARSILLQGQGDHKYENVRIGLNGRLDTFQAAILLAKLAAFPNELEKRQEVAEKYTRGLQDYVTTPVIPDGCASAWAQFSVLTDNRESMLEGLQKAGVP